MKKIIAMLVVATMLLTGVMAIVASANEPVVFYTIDVKENNDNTVDVTVSVNSDEGLKIAEMFFAYNAEVLECDEDSVNGDHWAISKKDSFDCYLDEPGKIYFAFEADDYDTGITADGKMMTASFKVIKEGATADEYGFDLKVYNDDPGNHIIVPDEDGYFSVVVNVIPAETTAPEDDETTAPEDDETTAPVVDETTAPEVDETTKPATKPQSPQTGDSMIYVAVIAVIALAACSTVVVVRSKKSSK